MSEVKTYFTLQNPMVFPAVLAIGREKMPQFEEQVDDRSNAWV